MRLVVALFLLLLGNNIAWADTAALSGTVSLAGLVPAVHEFLTKT
jgi:hypothetical protein